MNFTNLFRIALRALGNNKMRGFLTMLGIIIGVASVITMLAIGQGSKRSIRAQIAEMGSNMIMIHPGADMRGGVRLDAADMQSLKLEDYYSIVNEAGYVSACSPSVSSGGQTIYGANNYPTTMYGVNPDYLEIRKYSVAEGEMFSEQDILSSAKVCVIGKTIVDNLFTNGEEPVGKIIRFGKIPFRIIGVLASKGYNTMGMDQDDLMLAPYTTIQKRVLAITHLQSIFCSALTEEKTEDAEAEISSILRRNHKLKDVDDDDFNIRSQQELSTMMNSTTDMMTMLLACIAGISLLVGGNWNYEHHVCFGHGTNPGNRFTNVYRCERAGYFGPVSDRSDYDQRDRRNYRGDFGYGGFLDGENGGRLARLRTVVFGYSLFCCLYGYGNIFRLVSGSESFQFRSDRSYTL